MLAATAACQTLAQRILVDVEKEFGARKIGGTDRSRAKVATVTGANIAADTGPGGSKDWSNILTKCCFGGSK